MKRNLTIILVLMLVLLSAPAMALEPSEVLTPQDVLGTWYLISLDISGTAVSPADMGFEMTIVINEDGSAEMLATGSDPQSSTWKVENGALLVDDTAQILSLTPEGDTLIAVTGDGTLIFSREQASTSFVIAPVRGTTDIAEFEGVWVGTWIELDGTTVPLSIAGIQVNFKLSGGTAQTVVALPAQDAIETEYQGELKDGALVMTGENGDAMTVILHEDGTASFAMTIAGREATVYCESQENPAAMG